MLLTKKLHYAGIRFINIKRAERQWLSCQFILCWFGISRNSKAKSKNQSPKKGHDIEPNTIERRYKQSFDNLVDAMKFTYLTIRQVLKEIAEITNYGKNMQEYNRVNWFDNVIKKASNHYELAKMDNNDKTIQKLPSKFTKSFSKSNSKKR